MNDYDPPYAIARTTTEVMLYLDLTACPDCGSDAAEWQHDLHVGALRYVGACARCGSEREYLFSPPYQGFLDDGATFGGPEPSELVDAGQWLAVADWIAGEVPADDRSEAARAVMAYARQAVQEVLKFVPPAGDAVPDEAFWTDAGRAERERDPGRFRLGRLLAVRDSYSD
ncbi:hypothetical protein [Kribbella speibonae]|uniref:Uncharacterized protein n=1 Tax=Kribbella speibonae TaxID=1572660 RepID=A0ABY2AAM7_9ACTN|nr:hypothetical protein [Kribbella speibonae]TCC25497.1 hypothetical protein E0H58_15330 [Kribbella speibonae]